MSVTITVNLCSAVLQSLVAFLWPSERHRGDVGLHAISEGESEEGKAGEEETENAGGDVIMKRYCLECIP